MEDSKLPNEMIMEIMSWAQLKTIDTMRCTSKFINTLANESLVLDMNMKRNNMVSGFLIQNPRRGCSYVKEFAPSPKSKSLDLGFLQEDTRILATSEQGMIVFMKTDPTNNRRYSYYVCKPATKQISALPRPEGNHTVEKVAIVVMSSEPLHYKIIRFSDHNCLRRLRKFYSGYGCDIFDSLTGKWRSLKHIKLADLVHFTNSQLITVSGSIYMLLSNNDVLKLDAYTEKWKVFSSPIPYDESGFSKPPIELVKCGVRLWLACKPTRANGV
ncbi:F-box protein At5g41720-like [Bidens hawaiensis]|uniref:F-box protein At5g41720-like n=1 Tax=Bidens hawaiensis TaxID=980011 RepID=UPI00404969B8